MINNDYITDMIEPLCNESYCEFAIIEKGENVNAFFDVILETCYIVIKENQPIYVGYTSDINSRLRDHEYSDFKFGYYDCIVLVGYDGREDAIDCEKQLIKNLNPGLNRINYTGRNKKIINGKRVQVKYKAFRLPLDLIQDMGVYSAKTGTPLEDIATNAISEYLGVKNERL